MAVGAHKITEDFENLVAEYTGSPYCVAVDNCCNALLLCLLYRGVTNERIKIPAHTYPGVACEIIHAGGVPEFYPTPTNILKGAYQLGETGIWDSALRFTADMYVSGSLMCLSFTGPYKHLKLGKGGAILTDDINARNWLKKARYSGRAECSYHVDDFDHTPVAGYNFYMMPDVAARGVLLMSGFMNENGEKKKNDDLEIAYPDLSKFKIFNKDL